MRQPYAHQIRADEAIVQASRNGARAICLVIPAGGGKTFTAGMTIRRVRAQGRRVLWVAEKEELVDQAVEALLELGEPVGVVKAGRERNDNAPIQVASKDTLVAMLERGEAMPEADVIVFDECHHAVAATWRLILGRYPSLELLLGLTATPERGDLSPLGDIFEVMIVAATVRELQTTLRPDGHPILVPMRVVGPNDYQDELWRTPLEALLEFTQVLPIDPALICERAARGLLHPGDTRIRSTILFVSTVPEAHEIAALAKRHGIRAAALDGTIKGAPRRRVVDQIRNGEIDLFVNVQIATEGFDAPRVECVGVARGCSQASTWIQILSRAARSSPSTGKRKGLVLDFRGHSYIHGPLEWDRGYSLHGQAITVQSDPKLALRQCLKCGSIFERTTLPRCPHCNELLGRERQLRQRVRRTETVEITPDRLTPAMVKRSHYFKLAAEARARGHKPGAAKFKFKGIYGHWPPAAWNEEVEASQQ